MLVLCKTWKSIGDICAAVNRSYCTISRLIWHVQIAITTTSIAFRVLIFTANKYKAKLHNNATFPAHFFHCCAIKTVNVNEVQEMKILKCLFRQVKIAL